MKLNKSATETFVSLTEAYGDATLSRTMVFKWHKAFKEGQENVEDDPRSGRPISLSVRMIAEETGLNENMVHRILTEHLHMQKICAKSVPKNLSVEQKAKRLEICQDLLGRLETERIFLRKVITGDESWVFDYDSETKR